ncbi:hypothetical protein, partial [Propionibacterium freudenreichii]|uniref:hypothetical protein n=1 Tax=Propionibacterium freudenreichii TaxID=1744 RepID=UPI0038522804
LVYNADSVTIPVGAPVFLKTGATAATAGLDVLAGPSGITAAFFGIAAGPIAPGSTGYVIVQGYVPYFRVPAAATGVFGDTFLPTAASA